MRRGRLRFAILVAIVVLGAEPVAFADPPERGADDWSRIAPADVSLFVEIRDLAGIQARFRGLGIWDVVRKLSRPEQIQEAAEPWARRAERSLGLHPDEAIRRLLGRRAALLATNAENWQQGVLLAEVPNSGAIRALLRKWRAKPLAPVGPVQRYRLRGGTILAIRDSTLVFGPVEGAKGLWGRTVQLLSGGEGPNLGAQSDFAGLKWRLSDDKSGFAYVRWRDTTKSTGDFDRLMIGFTVGSSGLTCEIHGRSETATSRDATHTTLEVPCLGVGRLPASTIACWSTSFDFDGLTHRTYQERFPSDLSFIEMFLSFFLFLPGSGDGQAMLGPRFVVVVGSDARKTEDRFESPRVGVVLETTKPDALAAQLELIVQLFVGLTMSSQEVSRAPIRVETATCGGLEVRFVDLRSIEGGGFLSLLPRGTELCWVRLDDKVVLSTSRRHLESIIKASRGDVPRLGAHVGLAEPPPKRDRPPVCESCFVKGVEVSRMLSDILAFARREYPETQRKDWWQSWATDRLRQRSRLGLGLQDDPAGQARAVVAEIGPFSLANGRVILGDVIVEAGGAPLPTTRPAREVARRYRDCGDADTFSLKVLRGGRTRKVTLPVRPKRTLDLSGFDPPEVLRNLTALLGSVEHIKIRRFAAPRQSLHVTATLAWNRESPSDE